MQHKKTPANRTMLEKPCDTQRKLGKVMMLQTLCKWQKLKYVKDYTETHLKEVEDSSVL